MFIPKYLQTKGFSLIEAVISLFIIAVLSIGIYSLVILSLNLTAENKFYVEAIYIANQKMEQIRNLPYDDIGVSGGIPSGLIPQEEAVYRDGNYTVNTYITFYDDPFDGEVGSSTLPDSIPVDYKIATIKVSWLGKTGIRDVTVFSKIIPKTEETLAGYGLLKIYVVDANAAPLTGAEVRVINDSFSPAIDVTNLTNATGLLYLPAPESYQGYKIIVTKAGYGTDQTYPVSAENLSPTKINLSVTAGNKTEENFSIDRLATLRVKTVSNTLPANHAISQTGSSTKSSPRISFDSADNLYFTWQERSEATSSVLVQKFDSALSRQWANDLLVNNTDYQANPDIAAAADGTSLVVWQDNSTVLKSITYLDKKKADPSAAKLAFDPALADKLCPKSANKWSGLSSVASLKEKTKSFFKTAYTRFLAAGIEFYAQSRGKIALISSWLKTETPWSSRGTYAATETVTVVGTGIGEVTNNSPSITLSVPSGTAAGDFLLAFIYHDDYSDGPIAPPAGYGWQTLNNNLKPEGSSHADSRGAIFWKIVSAGDPANYTFFLPGWHSEQKAGVIRAYRGVDSTDPFDGSLLTNTAGTGNILRPAPSHSVSNDGSMLVCGWGTDTNDLADVFGGPTFPAGLQNTIYDYNTDVALASADLAVGTADSPTGNKNYNARKWVDENSIHWSLVLKPAILPDIAAVSAQGAQTASMMIPSSDQYLGGSFVIADTTGSRLVTAVTLTETGSVNAADDLGTVRLFYDLDETAPYDCADQAYNAGTDLQFGSDTTFSAASGTALFSSAGGIEISTTKALCLYPVVNINASADKDQTLDIEISHPASDISVSLGSVIPATSINLSGTTNLLKPAEYAQIHYRWRNDDGDEGSATWKEAMDTFTSGKRAAPLRLRLEISNTGSVDTAPAAYRLEYGKNSSGCAAVSSWTALPTDDSADWKIIDSPHLTDGATTTDSSALVNENTEFVPGEIKDSANQTGSIILSPAQFTEVEFSLQATASADDSAYCFRLTNAGSAAGFNYSQYPSALIIGDNNIYIKALDSNGNTVWGPKRINTDVAGEEQTNPVITLIPSASAATSVIAWIDGRNGNQDIYAQAFDFSGNKLWAADLLLSSSSDNDISPAITHSADAYVYVSWVNESPDGGNIALAKIDLAGNKSWSEPILIASSSNMEIEPKLSAGPGNDIFAVWTTRNITNYNLTLNRLDPSGSIVWQANLAAEALDYDQKQADLAYRNGNLFAAWTDYRQGNEDIYTQKIDDAGNFLWAASQRVNIHTDISSQNQACLAVNSANVPYSSWNDGRDGNSAIYAAMFNDPGALTPVANVPFGIVGSSQIGDNPIIYEYAASTQTDASGEAVLSVEWDIPGYAVSLNPASTSLQIIYTDPTQPARILPAEDKTLLIYVE